MRVGRVALTLLLAGYGLAVGNLTLITRLPTANREKRDKLLDAMTKVSNHAYEAEPGVLKYGLMLPHDEVNDTSMYSIEEYADQAAFDSHMATQEVKDMFDWINSADLYSETPSVHNLSYIEGLIFQRPEIANLSDPYVISHEMDYKAGLANSSLPSWKNVLTSSETENGTFIYGVLRDTSDPNTLRTLEVYESEAYFRDVHSKAKAVMENEDQMMDNTITMNQTALKRKGGFLYKASEISLSLH